MKNFWLVSAAALSPLSGGLLGFVALHSQQSLPSAHIKQSLQQNFKRYKGNATYTHNYTQKNQTFFNGYGKLYASDVDSSAETGALYFHSSFTLDLTVKGTTSLYSQWKELHNQYSSASITLNWLKAHAQGLNDSDYYSYFNLLNYDNNYRLPIGSRIALQPLYDDPWSTFEGGNSNFSSAFTQMYNWLTTHPSLPTATLVLSEHTNWNYDASLDSTLTPDFKSLSLAQKVINKVSSSYVDLPTGTDPDLKNPDTIAIIKKQLQLQNETLTSADLQTLSFSSDKPLTLTNVVSLQVTSSEGTVDTASKKILLAFHVPAASFINEMTNLNITLPNGTDPDFSDPTTVTALNQAFQKLNPAAPSIADFHPVYTSSETLTPYNVVNVQAHFAPTAQDQAETMFKVATHTSAQAIANKIHVFQFRLQESCNPNVFNPATQKVIKQNLQSNNPSLTALDLGQINFSTKSVLKTGTYIKITLEIASSSSDVVYKNILVEPF